MTWWNTRSDVFTPLGSYTKRIKLNSFVRNKQSDTREYWIAVCRTARTVVWEGYLFSPTRLQKYLNFKFQQKRAILQARVTSLKVFLKFCEFFLVVDLNPFVWVVFFHICVIFALFFAATIYEYPLDEFEV